MNPVNPSGDSPSTYGPLLRQTGAVYLKPCLDGYIDGYIGDGYICDGYIGSPRRQPEVVYLNPCLDISRTDRSDVFLHEIAR